MYRKNVASQNLPFLMIKAADGTALTGATVSGYRSIDGGAQGAVTGTITEKANGQYNLALSQADTNGNQIGYLFTASTAIPVHITISTTAADPTDTVRFGLTALPNAAANAAGGLPVSAAGALAMDTVGSNVAAIKTKTDFLPSVTAGASGGVFIAGTNAATAITTGLTTTFTGNLTGSVASVTGAVGSVTGAVGSVTGAVGSVTGNVGGNVTGSVGSVATGGIAAASFAAGAINAAAVAADAIGASELAADAVTEIVAGVYNAARASYTTAGTFGEGVASVQGSVTGSVASVSGAVGSVTGAVGSVTGSVGSVTGAVGSVTGNVTGSVGSLATQAKTDVENAVWDAATASHVTAGTTGVALTSASAPSAATVADAVWDEALAGHTGAGSAGLALSGASAPSAATVADAVWDEALAGHSGAGSAGLALSGASAPSAATVADAVWDEAIADHLTALTTGAALNAAGAAGDPWATAIPGAYGAGTAGAKLGGMIGSDNKALLSANAQTGVTIPTVTALTNDVGITQTAADKVWGTTARALTDKAGFALSPAGVQAIWDALTSALSAVGSVGKLLVDNVNDTISSRSTYAGGAVASVTGNVGGNVAGSVGSVTGAVGSVTGSVGSVTGAVGSVTGAVGSVTAAVTVGTNNDKTGYALTILEHTGISGDAQAALTAQGYTEARAGYLDVLNGLVAAVWDKALTAITAAGSIGKLIKDYLNAAVDSRAPANTALTNATWTDVKAGYIDAAVSTRSTFAGGAVASVTGAVGSVTGAVGSVTAAVALTADERNATADALLNRNLGAGTDTGGRTVRNALRPMVNKVTSAAGTLTVTKEDDVTAAWTAVLTTDAAADPITVIDPE